MIGMTVCSGIGAPEVAAPWIDWRYQSEIEPFPCAVLKARFPDAINFGDMTKFKEWPDANIDVLCGGTPCQSFSIAGLRKGLADPRGNLALTYLAIAERYRPRWLVWENVPGVLSALSHEAPDQSPPAIDLGGDNGPGDGEEIVVTDEYTSVEDHALWCFMAGAAELGYHGGFIHLDAQHIQTPGFPFAVPQRRDRLFFVGYLGDWRRAAAVLFDAESLRRNPPPRRKARENVAGTLGGSSQSGGFRTTDLDNNGAFIVSHEAAPCLTARERKGALPEADLSAVVPHTLKGEGFDASEDGTGRETPIVPVAIQERAISENPNSGPDGVGVRQDGAAFTLEARTTTQAVAFDTTQITSPGNFSQPKPGDPCHPLAAGAHPPAVAFDMRGREGGAMPEGPHDTANIRAASGGSSRSYVATPWAVRRLTPTECEKLMGFPDGWTAIEWRGKPMDKCPDGPRYKALGNSWAVNSGEYIFDRIKMVEEFFA
jgi:DNA (cytosine-5)-methyltransferase 1